jgi:tRNA pseudouridine55 synthase
VGHAGTLDPSASGILPVCLGQGTRIVEFLTEATKVYRAEIELGVTTDTYDATGRIVSRKKPPPISGEQLDEVLNSFRGVIQQVPPMFSALKYHGKPLYTLARAGITVTRKSRLANVYRCELVEYQSPRLVLEVECGKGTYIRSLAHDLGQLLGCGACLKDLVRQRCGPFTIEGAISLPELEKAFHYGYWQHFVFPLDSVLMQWRAVVVSPEKGEAMKKGQPLIMTGAPSDAGERCRAYNLGGSFLGVLKFDAGREEWQPDKVFG